MCDVNKINMITDEILSLSPEDLHQMIFEADTADKRDFYFMLNDYVLQRRQAEVIKSGVY